MPELRKGFSYVSYKRRISVNLNSVDAVFRKRGALAHEFFSAATAEPLTTHRTRDFLSRTMTKS